MSDAAKENKQADNAAKPKARALADVDANVSAQQVTFALHGVVLVCLALLCLDKKKKKQRQRLIFFCVCDCVCVCVCARAHA